MLALLVLPVLLVLAGCSSDKPAAVPRDDSDVEVNLTSAFAGDPGSLTADGHDFDIYDSTSSASGLTFSRTGMTHGAPTSSNAAGYLETRLPAPPQRIGADVVFSGGAKSGAFTFVDWLRSIRAQHAQPGGRPSQGSFHVTFTPTFVHIGVYVERTHTVVGVKAVTFAHPLPADGSTAVHLSLTRDGSQVTVSATGNPAVQASSPLFTSDQGDWPCWELYEQGPGFVPARVTGISAGT